MDKRYMAIGTSMLVLKLLEEEPLYGYQMIRLMEQRSRNVFQLKEGTLYPILHTLEQQGAVTSSADCRHRQGSQILCHYPAWKKASERKDSGVENL